MKQSPAFFEETASGAVTSVAFQFLSLPILVLGLLALGVARLARRWRTAGADR